MIFVHHAVFNRRTIELWTTSVGKSQTTTYINDLENVFYWSYTLYTRKNWNHILLF